MPAEYHKDPQFIQETTFVNRYPRLDELIPYGGDPGTKYCLVSGANTRKFFLEDGWLEVDSLHAITIVGERGTVDTVKLMGKGQPIKGAAQGNGMREYNIDRDIMAETGIPNMIRFENPGNVEAQIAAAKEDARNGRPPAERSDASQPVTTEEPAERSEASPPSVTKEEPRHPASREAKVDGKPKPATEAAEETEELNEALEQLGAPPAA